MQALCKRLEEFLGDRFSTIELALLYGSRRGESDTDVLAVLNTDETVEKRADVKGMDLSLIRKKDFDFRLHYWDIEYTDPVLTGEYICGNAGTLESSLEYLRTNRPSPDALRYLELRSMENLLFARIIRDNAMSAIFNVMYQMGGSVGEISSVVLFEKEVAIPSNVLLDSVHHLGYSLSYLAAEKRYENFTGAVTLVQMLESPQNDIEQKLAEVKSYHKSSKKLTLPLIKRAFSDTEDMIRKYMYGGESR